MNFVLLFLLIPFVSATIYGIQTTIDESDPTTKGFFGQASFASLYLGYFSLHSNAGTSISGGAISSTNSINTTKYYKAVFRSKLRTTSGLAPGYGMSWILSSNSSFTVNYDEKSAGSIGSPEQLISIPIVDILDICGAYFFCIAEYSTSKVPSIQGDAAVLSDDVNYTVTVSIDFEYKQLNATIYKTDEATFVKSLSFLYSIVLPQEIYWVQAANTPPAGKLHYVTFGTIDLFEHCANGCLTCSISTTNCTECLNGYLFYNNSCYTNCPLGTTQISNTQCESCSTNCDTCLSSGICIQCKSNTFLHNTVCLTFCPNGYYGNLTSNTCELCSVNCLTCLGHSTYCLECANDKYLSPNHICNEYSSSKSNENIQIKSSSLLLAQSSSTKQSVSVILTFDDTISNLNELENDIAIVLGLDSSFIEVILVSSTQVQVIITGQSLSEIQQNANTLIDLVNNQNCIS